MPQIKKVVLFGRPNVGKSTLFNCLCENKHALVSKVPGTTRDANIGIVSWQGEKLELIDTGGILDSRLMTLSKKKTDQLKHQGAKSDAKDMIDRQVQQQAREYIDQADMILFLVDARSGLLPEDKELALILKKLIINRPDDQKKKTKQPLLLVANKSDSPRIISQTAEFNQLGLGVPFPVSAATGSGTGDLLDAVVDEIKNIPKKSEKSEIKDPVEKYINIAIIGKPNVGKSSLVNQLLGSPKFIVSPIPHTTREPNDTKLIYKGQGINLIDTAGISKTGQKSARREQTKNSLEKVSIQKSLGVLRKADIALLVIDINEELTHQESKLVDEVVKSKTSLIIVANKWDLIKEKNVKEYTQKIYSHLPFVQWAPIHFVSALSGAKINKVFDLALEIAEERKTTVSDNALSKLLNKLVKIHYPAKASGTKKPHIFQLKQERGNPPVFSIRIGAKETLHFSYVRFLENRLREKYGFFGTPITLYVEKNKLIHGMHEEGKRKVVRRNKHI